MGETVTVCSAQYLTTLRSLPTFFSPLDAPHPPALSFSSQPRFPIKHTIMERTGATRFMNTCFLPTQCLMASKCLFR